MHEGHFVFVISHRGLARLGELETALELLDAQFERGDVTEPS